MDHLPYPKNAAHQPLTVQLLLKADESINNVGGDPVRDWRQASRGAPPLQQQTAHLQRCLYFGLISTCTGKTISVRDYSANGFLNSSPLPQLLLDKTSRCNVQTNAVRDTLRQVASELHAFTARLYRLAVSDPNLRLAQEVVLSVHVLTDALWRAYGNRPSPDPDLDHADATRKRHHMKYENPFIPAGLYSEILRSRMSWEDGWCTTISSYLLKTFSSSSVYYISALPRIKPAAGNHKHCTEYHCSLRYDEHRYQQKHTEGCHPGRGHCRAIEAPDAEIAKILQEGGIPLLQVDGVVLRASRAEYGVPYAAVTHVWAGGLGNPRGNAMNSCQLQEISGLISESHTAISHLIPWDPKELFPTIVSTLFAPFRWWRNPAPRRFWIDTLNIPRCDERSADEAQKNTTSERRTIAIDKMTQTYAAAESAIVLDPELRQLNIRWEQASQSPNEEDPDKNLLQIFASILVSSWMTRCWTYQEGAMGEELLVKLESQLFPMRLARETVLKRNDDRLNNHRYRDIHDMLDETSAWFSRLPATRNTDKRVGRDEITDESKHQPEVFTRIWNDLSARSTTRTADRLLILSLLVNLRPSEIRQYEPRNRLKAVLKAQKSLPLALLLRAPMTSAMQDEAEREYRKEEDAERGRGRRLTHHPQDTSYPLPTSLLGPPLTTQLGRLQQSESRKSIYFDVESLNAGVRHPVLFSFNCSKWPGAASCMLFDASTRDQFCVHLDQTTHGVLGRVNDAALAHSLFLLTDWAPRHLHRRPRSYEVFYGVLLARHDHEPIIGADGQALPNAKMHTVICQVSCDTFSAPSTGSQSSHGRCNISRRPLRDGRQYHIRCDFGDIDIPTGHRIQGFVPPLTVTVQLVQTVMPILLLYYLFCYGIISIPVFAVKPGAFSSGYYILLGFIMTFRLLYFSWNNLSSYPEAGNKIVFNEWVEGIQSGNMGAAHRRENPIFPRTGHTGLNVNMKSHETLLFLGVCAICIIVGAAKYENRNLRWAIAVGVCGIGEVVFVRWGLEHWLPRWTGWQEPSGEVPALRQTFVDPSRATLWLRTIRERF
jgi:hypothetical protein